MPAQGSVHNGQRAPHQTLGTRTRCRGRADAARSEPASHACAPRNRRASVWHAEDADGGDALFDEDAAEGGDRDGAARARLHPEVVDADLADYFGSIPHAELLQSVARRIVDRRVLHLIKMWLDSVALYERIGDLAAHDLVRAHFHALTHIVASQGGAIVRTNGDAVMRAVMHEQIPGIGNRAPATK